MPEPAEKQDSYVSFAHSAELRRNVWLDQVDDDVLEELTDQEKIELARRLHSSDRLQRQLLSMADHAPGHTRDVQESHLIFLNRVNQERINEIIEGYPQTGSLASVVAKRGVRRGEQDSNPRYRLVQQTHFFKKNLEILARAEKETFGADAFAESQLGLYTPVYRGNAKMLDTDSFAIAFMRRRDPDPKEGENTDEDMDELCAYLLALCSSNPSDPSPLGRDLPEGTILLNALGTSPRHRGRRLGLDLGNILLAFAGNRTVYETVKPDNFGMMSLLSQLGEVYRDPNYVEGLQAGRSRSVELLYWDNHYSNSSDGDRVISFLDPGLFIADNDATLRSDDLVIDPRTEDAKQYLGRDRIVLRNEPGYNSIGKLRSTDSFKGMVSTLLENGQYIGVPLGRNHRLYIRVDSLEPRTARIIHEHYRVINERRERDYMRHFGRKALTNW